VLEVDSSEQASAQPIVRKGRATSPTSKDVFHAVSAAAAGTCRCGASHGAAADLRRRRRRRSRAAYFFSAHEAAAPTSLRSAATYSSFRRRPRCRAADSATDRAPAACSSLESAAAATAASLTRKTIAHSPSDGWDPVPQDEVLDGSVDCQSDPVGDVDDYIITRTSCTADAREPARTSAPRSTTKRRAARRGRSASAASHCAQHDATGSTNRPRRPPPQARETSQQRPYSCRRTRAEATHKGGPVAAIGARSATTRVAGRLLQLPASHCLPLPHMLRRPLPLNQRRCLSAHRAPLVTGDGTSQSSRSRRHGILTTEITELSDPLRPRPGCTTNGTWWPESWRPHDRVLRADCLFKPAACPRFHDDRCLFASRSRPNSRGLQY